MKTVYVLRRRRDGGVDVEVDRVPDGATRETQLLKGERFWLLHPSEWRFSERAALRARRDYYVRELARAETKARRMRRLLDEHDARAERDATRAKD